MTALFAGLTTVDVLHGLNHTPDPHLKVTSTDFLLAAGGPATNAAITYATLNTLTSTPNDTHLLTTIGHGPLAHIITDDLTNSHITTIDTTSPHHHNATPAISSIIDHPTGRMVASTNAQITPDPTLAWPHLATINNNGCDAVLIDGHNPTLAELALRVGTSHFPNTPKHATNSTDNDDPFADLEEKPTHPRILDGGSWKPWLTPLLGYIDIAVISADFTPPLLTTDNPDAIADFLRGFGIHRIIRTNGAHPIQWWWDNTTGHTPVPHVTPLSTLGAGDIFHGAFTWAAAHANRHNTLNANPTPLITFAAHIAATSVTHFGTRTWSTDPAITRLATDYIHQWDK